MLAVQPHLTFVGSRDASAAESALAVHHLASCAANSVFGFEPGPSAMPKPNSFLTTRELAVILLFLIAAFAVGLRAQTGQTATPQQAPRTAPQVEKILPSYEGQKVTSVELAGQPNLNPNTLLPQLPVRAGEPFSQQNVDASAALLKKLGGYQAVELEVRPEADGVRVLFVLQPAIYFGIYRFPGAEKQFA